MHHLGGICHIEIVSFWGAPLSLLVAYKREKIHGKTKMAEETMGISTTCTPNICLVNIWSAILFSTLPGDPRNVINR